MKIKYPEKLIRIKCSIFKHLSACVLALLIILTSNSCNTEKAKERAKVQEQDFSILKKSLRCINIKDSCHKRLRISRELYGELLVLEKKRTERGLVGKYLSCQSEYFLKTGLDTIWVDGCELVIPQTWKIKEPIIRIYRYYYR